MTNTLTCIIVDDDALDRLAVETALKTFCQIKLLGSFEHAAEALEMISSARPDLLFIDVDMPDISGLQLFKGIQTYAPQCVVISSHPEYALECFELKVFDYILKPVETDRFTACIKRLDDFLALKEKAQSYDVLFDCESIVFKEGYSTVRLQASEVIYLEAFGDYTKIVTEKKTYLTLVALSSFLTSLPAGKFMRIHRSYVIAISKVHCFHVKQIDMGTSMLPVGKTYLHEARAAFKLG
uniref:LytR/AlgR family response regulator transcription factor n=1 Tax=Pedobacter schmidteae TaxID=2201271 RepID=UPI000EAD6CD5|nr:LytTR family DNA-binding domain-containing protein [Pedobacter schmidteae]